MARFIFIFGIFLTFISASGAVLGARGNLDEFFGSGPGNHALARFLIGFGLDISVAENENPRPELSIEIKGKQSDINAALLANLDTSCIELNTPMERSRASLTKWHFEQLGYRVELLDSPDAQYPDMMEIVIWVDQHQDGPQDALNFIHQVGFKQAAFRPNSL